MKKFKQKLGLFLILTICLIISACNTRSRVENSDNLTELGELSPSESSETENSQRITFVDKSYDKSANDTQESDADIDNTSQNKSTDLSERKSSKRTSRDSNTSQSSEEDETTTESSNPDKTSNELARTKKSDNDGTNTKKAEGKYESIRILLDDKKLILPFSTQELIDLGYESAKTGELEQYSYALDVPFINTEASEDLITVDIINLEEKPRTVDSAPVYSITINNYGVFSDLKLSNGVDFNSTQEEIINAHANKHSSVAQIENKENETVIKFESTENSEITAEYTLVDSKLIRIKLTTDKFLAPQ